MKNIKKKRIILFSVIAIILVVAICLVILLVSNRHKVDNNIETSTEVNEEQEQNQDINTNEEDLNNDTDYNALKNYINETSIMYVIDNYSYMENTIIKEISLSMLVDNNYIEDETILKLYNDGVCDAYSIITANAVEIDGNTYLKCKNYMTEGYDDSHLEKDSIDGSDSNMPIDSSNNQGSNENSKIVIVEDYTGKNYKEVKKMLEALNLNVYVESRDIPEGDDPSDYEEGIIMAQSVEAGTKLSEGDSITLYIPSLDNKYPDFVTDEYTVAEVEDFAEDYEITLNIVYEDTTEYAPGTIIRQSRAAGSTVVSGARLTITVAK